MSDQFWHRIVEFCDQLIIPIGEQLLKDFGKVAPELKEDGSLLTKCDQWADQTITKAIQAAFPDHGILTEESNHVFPDTDWCWIIDPIDGTTNFTRGIPVWGTAIGLLYQGIPVFGYIHFPQIKQTFHGFYFDHSELDGKNGAFLNKQPMCTSQAAIGHSQLFNLCTRSTKLFQQPFPCKLRLIGVASYNMMLVASGAALGLVEATPKIWDLAGAIPILQAAGGAFTIIRYPELFPLQAHHNYGKQALCILATSQPSLINEFLPRVTPIAFPEG